MTNLYMIEPSTGSPEKTAKTAPSRQAQLGQFHTPDSVAHFMAGMFYLPITLMDAGAGNGSATGDSPLAHMPPRI